MKKIIQLLFVFVPAVGLAQSEFVVNTGTDIRINPGCQVIFAEGGMQNSSGQLSNAGELVVEGNLLNDGNLVGGNGSGLFRVLNDVENNGTMTPGQSEFELYGEDQFLRGSQQLDFHHLTLTGGGVKFMLNSISTTGTMNLGDRELRAGPNTAYHLNVNPASVLAIHDQGFLSATGGGGLSRLTSGSSEYIFPVGSTQNGLKIRPFSIAPSGGSNTYKVRFALPTPNAFQRGPELHYVNPVFYHVAELTDGTEGGAVTVYYDVDEDGFFQTLAHTESDFWRENAGTIEGPLLGSAPELVSFKTPSWNFSSSDIALAALGTELFVPNVFSPNNDGRNDVFRPRGTEPFGYMLRIYDRWGNKVFESEAIADGWDGTFNGKPLNSGVFVYYILSSGEVMDKGNVTLVR